MAKKNLELHKIASEVVNGIPMSVQKSLQTIDLKKLDMIYQSGNVTDIKAV